MDHGWCRSAGGIVPIAGIDGDECVVASGQARSDVPVGAASALNVQRGERRGSIEDLNRAGCGSSGGRCDARGDIGHSWT
jgi:hypothetical protein